MKSVRLGSALEERLARAAQAAHVPESEIIRKGVTRQVDEILGTSLYEQIKPFIGAVRGTGPGVAGRAHEAAGEMIAEEHDRQVAEWERRRSS